MAEGYFALRSNLLPIVLLTMKLSTRYMAPELMQGDQSKTCLSDTYAYAMLMIEVSNLSFYHPMQTIT